MSANTELPHSCTACPTRPLYDAHPHVSEGDGSEQFWLVPKTFRPRGQHATALRVTALSTFAIPHTETPGNAAPDLTTCAGIALPAHHARVPGEFSKVGR
ncbi:hypothetical protein GCM10027200_04330 [Lentzea nigeriaca]